MKASVPSFIIFFIFLFSTATSTYAKQCQINPDLIKNKGADMGTLFEDTNPANECAYTTDNSPIDDQTIYEGRLTCKQGVLSAELQGKLENINTFGRSRNLEINLDDISTFSIDGNILSTNTDDGQTHSDKLVGLRKTFEAYKNQDITNIIRDAYSKGVDSYPKFVSWACDRGLCLTGSDGSQHINPSIFSAASSQTPLKDQILSLYQTAKDIYACKNSAYAETHRCSTFNITQNSPGSTETTFDIASMVIKSINPDDPLGSYENLSDKQKWQLFTVHLRQSSPTFILFLPLKEDCRGGGIGCILSNLLENLTLEKDPQPAYIKKVIIESTNFQRGINEEVARFSPLASQNQAAAPSPVLIAANDSATDAISNQAANNSAQADQTPVDCTNTRDPLLNKLCARAIKVDPGCTMIPPEDFENLGSSANPPENSSDIAKAFSYIFNAFSQDQANQDQHLFNVYIFSPPDLVDANNKLSSDNNALLAKLLPLNDPLTGGSITGFDKKIDAPQAFDSNGSSSTDPNYVWNGDYREECVTDMAGNEVCHQVPIETPNAVTYNATINKANQAGGWLPLKYKYTSFGLFRPLNAPDNIQDQSLCLAPWISNGVFRETGYNPALPLKMTLFDQSNCPNPLNYLQSGNKSENISVCAVADEYGIPCCQLEGIMQLESGYGTDNYKPGTGSCGSFNCCTGIGCGPAQISCGQIGPFSGGDNLDVCDPADAAELLSRAMLLKLCQAAGKCNSYDWSQWGDFASQNYSVSDGNYTAAAYFNGLENGCTLSGCSQLRWGAGNGYCDAVGAYCDTGDLLPSVYNMDFCDECNEELARSGVQPISCPSP